MQPSVPLAWSIGQVRGAEIVDEAAHRQDALHDAFQKHYPALLRLSVVLARSREPAEDLAQESFVKIAPRIGQLPEEEVWPYLRQTAVNLSRNRWRRLSLERLAGRSRAEPLDPSKGVDERDETWRAIKRLPPRQRACVALRYYEDLPEAEIAEVLGCSIGTVKSQLSRASARLRKELSR
jgi:RNA polymerase sigma-70 factor (sigma-E family)